MKKFILTLTLICVTMAASAALSGTWRVFPTFDNSATHVADSPDYVYFTGLTQEINTAVPVKAVAENSLFRYDKESDEIVGLSKTTGLASTAINRIEYNPTRGYLLILYNDLNIDLLYDSGEIYNFSALKSAQIPGSKGVNGISFFPKEDMIILATDFGYVAINDKKLEVVESRNYNKALTGAVRIGNHFVIARDSRLYSAPWSSRRMTLDEYGPLGIVEGAETLVDMGDKDEAIIAIRKNPATLYFITNPGGTLTVKRTQDLSSHYDYSRGNTGVTIISRWGAVRHISYDNKLHSFVRPESEYAWPVSSWDGVNFYVAGPRKGLRCDRPDFDNLTYTTTKDFALPNAPNVYISRAMVHNPGYGMLVNNYGCEGNFQNTNLSDPMLLSGYKNGLWTPLSPTYRNPAQRLVGQSPLSMVIDPDDPKYIYTGSYFSGITRTNLDDAGDILHMTHPRDVTAGLPGYAKLHETTSWTRLSRFASLCFDHNNVLWSVFLNWDGNFQFMYWLPEERRASTDAAHFRPWHTLEVADYKPGSFDEMLALKAPANRGILIASSNNTGHPVMVYDHKNTLDNTADDEKVIMTGIVDQDGGVIDPYNVHCILEDTDSGAVWIGADTGIYYFQPRSALQGQNVWNRVKVARNDGTTLADYLLNGIHVNHIAVDNAGRKWISTGGAGLVVVSADGRTVIDELTAANSMLISDNVYYSCYNPDNHSVMISTDKGLCEFTLAGGASNVADSNSGIRAYPNPVAPDYYGWVTIDGLEDNAQVKIVDSEGNLVRELGRAESGVAQWDVLNMYGKRVRTGVYFVMSSEGKITKLLVMN